MTLREVDNMSEWRKDTVNGQAGGQRGEQGRGRSGRAAGGEVRGQKLASKTSDIYVAKTNNKAQREEAREREMQLQVSVC